MFFMRTDCGTNIPNVETIDLDRYSTRHETNADTKDLLKAFEILNEFMCDSDFANDGHRNHCAVNCCIALHVLGYDAKEWFENWCNDQKQEYDKWYMSDLDKFMGHVERVYPYLKDWGPKEHEELALGFALD